MPPKLLTVSEVATALRMDEFTVRRWARQGKLPTVRLTRSRVLIPEGGLADVIARSTEGGASQPAA